MPDFIPLYSQSPAAVRAATVAECLRIVRDEYVGDGGGLSDQQEGYNDAVYQIDNKLSALSRRPTVSREWIVATAKTVWNAEGWGDVPELSEGHLLLAGISAALTALGYEITEKETP